MVLNLGQLKTGQKGVIVAIAPDEPPGQQRLAQHLMELGFIEGADIELLHEAPIWKDPIAVRTRGTLVALRRSEAARVLVEVSDELR